MVVDLHAHYPMHLIPPSEAGVVGLIGSRRQRGREVGSRLWNYPGPAMGPAVTARSCGPAA